jgi:hypothetical protein
MEPDDNRSTPMKTSKKPAATPSLRDAADLLADALVGVKDRVLLNAAHDLLSLAIADHDGSPRAAAEMLRAMDRMRDEVIMRQARRNRRGA